MTIEPLIRDVTPEDLDWLAPRLRAGDRAEAEAMSGMGAREALRFSVKVSRETWIAEVAGEPLAIFGIAGAYTSPVARPWMVGTDAIGCYKLSFMRFSRALVADWRGRFDVLENWVDARHLESVRWLGWLGFTLDEPKPFGPFKMPFHRFEMRG